VHRIRFAALVVAALVLTAGSPTAVAAVVFPSRDEALARPSLVVQSGTTSAQYRIGSPPPDTTYDLRGLTSTAYPSATTYPLSFGKDAPGFGTVVVGGTVLGSADLATTWQDMKANFDGTALLMFGQGAFASYDLHADDMFDFFRPRPPGGDLNGGTFLIADCHGTNIRDDAIENDQEMSGTIRNCVFDGINSGVSIGQNTTNPAAVTEIDDTTFIFKPFPNLKAADGMGHAVLFKQMGGGQVVMHNDLVCYSETPIAPERLMNWMPGTYENVTIVLGPGFDGDGDGDLTDLDHPGTLPPGATQTRDWSLCDPSAPPPPPTGTPPAISVTTPASANVGASVTLAGSGFTDATSVSFNGTNASFSVDSDTQITAVVPQGATTGRVSVAGPWGSCVSTSDFTVLPPPPSITGLAPASGVVGASMTIAGTGFTSATNVWFNGTTASFGVDSDTQITAVVPQGATSGLVSVDGPGGTGRSASSFTVLPPQPSITGLAPASGAVGASVTITGTGFTGATKVWFNGTSADFTVSSDTQITAVVPQGATTGPVSIDGPGGSSSSPSTFTVVLPPPPAVTGMSPALGTVGTTVTIAGSGLAKATAVRFNGTNAGFTVNSDTQITAVVPQGASTGPITVTGPGGLGTSSTNFIITATLTFAPAADTYVASGTPTKNYGTATTLQLGQSPKKDLLLKFTLSGIGTRTVLSARLSLYCVRASTSGGTFYPTANTSWGEKTVTWKTAPAAGLTSVAAIGPVAANTWSEVDLSSLVRADGTYSLRVPSGSITETQYTSKEGKTTGLRPKLVVIVG
jgi:IPT/TIG domain-containing protein